jgi:hypothetical protein
MQGIPLLHAPSESPRSQHPALAVLQSKKNIVISEGEIEQKRGDHQQELCAMSREQNRSATACIKYTHLFRSEEEDSFSSCELGIPAVQ